MVQNPSNSEYYTPSSEPFRIYISVSACQREEDACCIGASCSFHVPLVTKIVTTLPEILVTECGHMALQAPVTDKTVFDYRFICQQWSLCPLLSSLS
jgi:hypothetical protein